MKTFLIASAALLVSHILFSQSPAPESGVTLKGTKWKLSSIYVRHVNFDETLGDLTYSDLSRLLKQPIDLDMTGYRQSDFYSSLLVGTKISAGIGIARRVGVATYSEFTLAVNNVMDAELMLDYEIDGDEYLETLTWCYILNRVNVEAGYKLRFTNNKRLSLAVGPSLGFGTTYNDQLIFFGSSKQLEDLRDDTVEAKSSRSLQGHLDVFGSLRVWKGLAVSGGGQIGVNHLFAGGTGYSANVAFGLEYQFFRHF